MRLAAAITAAALVSAVAFLPASVSAQGSGNYVLRGTDPVIYDLAGTIRVEPGSGDGVGVAVTLAGADAAKLRVAQGQVRGRDALRIVYPGDRLRYPAMGSGSTTLRVRNDGTFDRNDDDEDRGRRLRIGDSGDEAWADLRVAVPAGHQLTMHLAVGAVTLTNVDGRIAVEASAAPIIATGSRGELSFETGAGKIDISNFQGETVAAETGAGEVSAGGVKARTLKIETGAGDVRLSDLQTPTIKVETGSGNVTADLTGGVESLRIQTGSGNVAITAPPSLGAVVDLETGSGDVDLDFPLTIVRTGRDHVRGTIGDGHGRIAVSTGSGDVRLRKAS